MFDLDKFYTEFTAITDYVNHWGYDDGVICDIQTLVQSIDDLDELEFEEALNALDSSDIFMDYTTHVYGG